MTVNSIPEGKSGSWSVVKHDGIWLMQNDTVWMSSAAFEDGSHDHFIQGRRGSVLLGGLGLGYDFISCMDAGLSVEVVEREQDVINLVGPYVGSEAATLHHADLLDFFQRTKNKYDYIFVDIFLDEPENHADEMQSLIDKAPLNEGGEIVFWRPKK